MTLREFDLRALAVREDRFTTVGRYAFAVAGLVVAAAIADYATLGLAPLHSDPAAFFTIYLVAGSSVGIVLFLAIFGFRPNGNSIQLDSTGLRVVYPGGSSTAISWSRTDSTLTLDEWPGADVSSSTPQPFIVLRISTLRKTRVTNDAAEAIRSFAVSHGWKATQSIPQPGLYRTVLRPGG